MFLLSKHAAYTNGLIAIDSSMWHDLLPRDAAFDAKCRRLSGMFANIVGIADQG